MGHLFLDIENYALDDKNAFNPYAPESKVILIAYNYYKNEKPPVKNEIKTPIFLKEWESDEKTILEDFLIFLKTVKKRDHKLKIHGFNILRFDLPYLFGRMKIHSLAEDHELHRILFCNLGVDMTHISYFLSDADRNKEKLWGIDKHNLDKFFNDQKEEGTEIKCSKLYDKKYFDEILQHCADQFKFEQLMNSFYLYAKGLGEGRL